MLTKAVKQEIIREFNEKFKSAPSLFVVEYKGLKVKEMEELRKRLKKARAEFRVVKNNLLKLASRGTEIEKVQSLFEGPTAVAVCQEDPVSVSKIFVESAKELPVLKLKGGIIEGKVVSVEDISKLSELPSREVLLSQFVGLLSSPISNFIYVLLELQRHLLYALYALKEQKEKSV
ncbi:MAG: 50S ribosomal protein L10 [Deltaproteobacteria bacterium]|jgi:large subunit ribosomal protein L10|nr:MAG: 50S ribosomal protein L10 [Deltaproteobacteria bacterium]